MARVAETGEGDRGPKSEPHGYRYKKGLSEQELGLSDGATPTGSSHPGASNAVQGSVQVGADPVWREQVALFSDDPGLLRVVGEHAGREAHVEPLRGGSVLVLV